MYNLESTKKELKMDVNSIELDALMLDRDIAKNFILKITRLEENLWTVEFQNRAELMIRIKENQNE